MGMKLHHLALFFATFVTGILGSGCTTTYLWNDDTRVVVERREGRVSFSGERWNFLQNERGDLAYPGRMTFAEEAKKDFSVPGWLIVPAEIAPDWKTKTDDGYAATVNRPAGWRFGKESGMRFIPAKNFVFIPAGSSSPAVSPEGFSKAPGSPAGAKEGECGTESLEVFFDPLVRSDSSGNLDTLAKVALTPPAVVADAATVAVAIPAYILIGAAFMLGSL